MNTTAEKETVTINGVGVYRIYPARADAAILRVENFWGWDCGTLAQRPSVIGPVWYCCEVPETWDEWRVGRTPAELVMLLAPLLWQPVTEEDECDHCDGGYTDPDQLVECEHCSGRGVHLRHYLTIDILRRERTPAPPAGPGPVGGGG